MLAENLGQWGPADDLAFVAKVDPDDSAYFNAPMCPGLRCR